MSGRKSQRPSLPPEPRLAAEGGSAPAPGSGPKPAAQGRGDFGAYLRRTREAKGISLQHIAASTKISLSRLEALEQNEISRLPGGIFTRSFLRSYAVQVGLDPERTVREFLARYPDASIVSGDTPLALPERPSSSRSSSLGKWATRILVGALVVAILAVALYYTLAAFEIEFPPIS